MRAKAEEALSSAPQQNISQQTASNNQKIFGQDDPKAIGVPVQADSRAAIFSKVSPDEISVHRNDSQNIDHSAAARRVELAHAASICIAVRRGKVHSEEALPNPARNVILFSSAFNNNQTSAMSDPQPDNQISTMNTASALAQQSTLGMPHAPLNGTPMDISSATIASMTADPSATGGGNGLPPLSDNPERQAVNAAPFAHATGHVEPTPIDKGFAATDAAHAATGETQIAKVTLPAEVQPFGCRHCGSMGTHDQVISRGPFHAPGCPRHAPPGQPPPAVSNAGGGGCSCGLLRMLRQGSAPAGGSTHS